jgi:hypothetical protein
MLYTMASNRGNNAELPVPKPLCQHLFEPWQRMEDVSDDNLLSPFFTSFSLEGKKLACATRERASVES